MPQLRWSNEQRVSAAVTYFPENKSIVAVQRALRTRYGIPLRNTVLDRKSIFLWNNSCTFSSDLQTRDENRGIVRSPENMDRVRRSILQYMHSPLCFLTVRRPLLSSTKNAHQKLSEQDWQNRLQTCETSIHTLPRDAGVCLVTRRTPTFLEV